MRRSSGWPMCTGRVRSIKPPLNIARRPQRIDLGRQGCYPSLTLFFIGRTTKGYLGSWLFICCYRCLGKFPGRDFFDGNFSMESSFDLGNFLEGIFFLVFGNFLEGIFLLAIKLTSNRKS